MARLPPCPLFRFVLCSLLPSIALSRGCLFVVFQVQLVSGASPLAYWLSSYIWDALLFFVLTVLVMLAFAAYGADASKVLIRTL